MKSKLFKHVIALLLALVCAFGILPLSAFADGLSTAPATITQKSCDYMYSGGNPVHYKPANSTVSANGPAYVFDEQVDVPGYGTVRAMCAYQAGTLGSRANGQRWNFQREITHPSLKLILTFIYAHTYGDFTDAGKAAAMETWGPMWSDVWFVVAQSLTWCNQYGVLIDYSTDKPAGRGLQGQRTPAYRRRAQQRQAGGSYHGARPLHYRGTLYCAARRQR